MLIKAEIFVSIIHKYRVQDMIVSRGEYVQGIVKTAAKKLEIRSFVVNYSCVVGFVYFEADRKQND
jgi:hypothetical protein